MKTSRSPTCSATSIVWQDLFKAAALSFYYEGISSSLPLLPISSLWIHLPACCHDNTPHQSLCSVLHATWGKHNWLLASQALSCMAQMENCSSVRPVDRNGFKLKPLEGIRHDKFCKQDSCHITTNGTQNLSTLWYKVKKQMKHYLWIAVI